MPSKLPLLIKIFVMCLLFLSKKVLLKRIFDIVKNIKLNQVSIEPFDGKVIFWHACLVFWCSVCLELTHQSFKSQFTNSYGTSHFYISLFCLQRQLFLKLTKLLLKFKQ